jgi:hypothetical protein
MWRASHLHIEGTALQFPGAIVESSPTDFHTMRYAQLRRFDGESWRLFGDVIRG